MKKRFLALLCCLCLVFSVFPSIQKVQAKGTTDAKRLDTAEEAITVLNKKGHGSHVAGIITQATPEEVKIMAVRVFDATGSASYEIITMAVDYAVEQKADVINMSLGFEIAPGYENAQTELMDEAFARAISEKTTICAASGNEYTDTARSYPASSLWTITVGLLEPDQSGSGFICSDFSNNGTLLDFVGPGRHIYSAWGEHQIRIQKKMNMKIC